jgi:NAD(P)-dependent dehydrogenase (short-subunit alcohol dehydrogenase family)
MTSANIAVALVTGANRGIGRVFTRELIARGAARVYGSARNPDRIDVPGVVPIWLDITDPAQVAAAANQCRGAAVGASHCASLRTRRHSVWPAATSITDLSRGQKRQKPQLVMCATYAPNGFNCP